jgi:hypothetical protein
LGRGGASCRDGGVVRQRVVWGGGIVGKRVVLACRIVEVVKGGEWDG